MIDEILDEFDFEKVYRVMVALDCQERICCCNKNWKWYREGEKINPSIADLRRTARSLLKQVVESKGLHSVGTGGFTAYMQQGLLGLRFEVSSYEIELEKGIGQ